MSKLLNEEEIKSNQIELELEEDLWQSINYFLRMGLTLKLTLQQKNKVNQLRILNEKNKLEGKKTEVLLSQQLKVLESDVSGLISKKMAATVNLDYQSIKSPVKGVVFDLSLQM